MLVTIHSSIKNIKNIFEGECNFQYDYKNRLVKATRKVPGEYMIVTMEYDNLGRRVMKNVDRKSNEGENVRYTYSFQDAIQEDWTYNIGDGRNLKKEYIYGEGIDNVISMIHTRGTETRQFWFQKNHQGSVIAVSDGSGKVVESYRYDTFGNIILGFQRNSGKQSTLAGAKNEQRNTAESKMWLKNDRLYTSREYDEELGMYYYRGRHYDPRVGRFIQRDPIGMSDDVNLYRYVGNNPMNYNDPFGLKKEALSAQIRNSYLGFKEKYSFAIDVGVDLLNMYMVDNSDLLKKAEKFSPGITKRGLEKSIGFGEGVVFGESIQDPNLEQIAGSVVGSELPFYSIVADSRDVGVAVDNCIAKGVDGSCLSNVGINIIGYVPFIGAIKSLKYTDELYKLAIDVIKSSMNNSNDILKLLKKMPPDLHLLGHVFDPKHSFDSLLKTYGNDQLKLFSEIQDITLKSLKSSDIASDGVYKTVINLNGIDIHVQGRILDGKFYLGDAWTLN